jgi:meso-butanediol dehydrogenase/(S,S)-butanediol dehydrogenase/diacetyl reductase
MKLAGKVAIVTGAGRGIGQGIALCLAKEGADIVVNSLHEETTNKTTADVKSLGRRALAIAGDITKRKMVEKVVQDTIGTFGKIDILVNNVGGGRTPPEEGSFLERIEVAWQGGYEQNLKSTVLMCKAIVPHFIKQKNGKIVNIASDAARHSFPHLAPQYYAAFKTGVFRFTQSMAYELGEHNINVNCICPGIIYTDGWKMLSQRMVTKPEYMGIEPREWFVNFLAGKYPAENLTPETPLRREQTAEDIGHAVVFLVSEDARNITGQALNVDGGLCQS